MLRRCGVPRGWKLGLIGVAVVLAVEPIRTTLGYGQVNTLLMALVVADLLPDAPGERRRIPQGTLIGLAAAIKLTPALFVVFAFLIGQRRTAVTAMVSFAVFTGLGAILLFAETVAFFGGLAGGDTRTASPLYVGNQSLLGVFVRLGDSSRVTTLIGLAIAGLVALLGTLVAAHWWRRGSKVFGVALVGLTTCLASPLSWTHHYVWILPFAVALFAPGLPRWVRYVGGFWVVWVCACLPLALLPYGGAGSASTTAAAAGGQPGTAGRRAARRGAGRAAGGQHPACLPPTAVGAGQPAVTDRRAPGLPHGALVRLPAMTGSTVDIKPRSRVVTDGLEATASRGMLRAVGMGDEDWVKPQIGVASSWNEITPCNLAWTGWPRRSRTACTPPAATRWSSAPSRSPTASRWATRACTSRWSAGRSSPTRWRP